MGCIKVDKQFKNELDYSPMKGISRIDNKKERCWFVRVNWSNKKPSIQKKFYDSKYDKDVNKSFEAAAEFRNKNIIISKRSSHHLEGIEKEGVYTEKKVRNLWKKERLERRLKAIEKFGRGKVYVGIGVEGMNKAREMGASKVTCWKILTGKQNCYNISNFMPNYHLSWKNKSQKKLSDIEVQKIHGKKKIIIGYGREAALQAQKAGMSQQVCNQIFSGKQNFFYICYSIPYFEANGFLRNVPQKVETEIKNIAYKYASKDAIEIIQECLINYSSRTEIPNQECFVRNLTFKYININKMKKWHTKEKRKFGLLDINGDIEKASFDGDSFYGVGTELIATDDWNPSI